MSKMDIGELDARCANKVPQFCFELASLLSSWLNDLKQSVSIPKLATLKDLYAQPNCPNVDYDHYAKEFAYGYLLQNYWKTVLTFVESPPQMARRLLDAGCGSGASSIAYLAFMESRLDREAELEIVLADRCGAQLTLARDLLQCILPMFRHLRVKPELLQTDISTWQPQKPPDLILLGHVLTENRSGIDAIVQHLSNSVSEEGRIYTIERAWDPVWSELEDSAVSTAFPVVLEETCPARTCETAALSGLIDAHGSVSTRFLVIRAPERKYYATLMKDYFRAWNERSLALLDKVFGPNATYQEKYFEPAMCGLDAIKSYWTREVLPQCSSKVRICSVAYCEGKAFAEWRSHFQVNGVEVRLRGLLVLEIDRHLERVVALRECFKAVKEPLG